MSVTWQLQHSWNGRSWFPGADRYWASRNGLFAVARDVLERQADEAETSEGEAVMRFTEAVEYWAARDILDRPFLRVCRIEHTTRCIELWGGGGHADTGL